MAAEQGDWKDVPTLDEIVGAMVADLEDALRRQTRPVPVMRRYGYVMWDWWLAAGRQIPPTPPRYYTEDGVRVSFAPWCAAQASEQAKST